LELVSHYRTLARYSVGWIVDEGFKAALSMQEQAHNAAAREELQKLHTLIATRFGRPEVRERAGRYLTGLLGPMDRRTARQMARQIGEGRADGAQRLLNQARWDADAVRDDLRDYVVERLGDQTGALVLVETGFPKKGLYSAGVARQSNPTSGRIEDCQVGLFLAYASPRGWAFIDRALYLPEKWAEDEVRRGQAGVPQEIIFTTKGELARAMLERAFGAGVSAAWVSSGGSYGEHEQLWRWLEATGRSYVLAVSPSHELWKRIDGVPRHESAQQPPAITESWLWRHMEVGANTWWAHDREWVRHLLAYPVRAGWERWLLTGRSVVQQEEHSFHRVYVPEGRSLATQALMAGPSLTVEEGLEQAKDKVGLDQYEVRQWDPWHRHITLCLLAHASLQVARARAQSGGEHPSLA
jgi:SRSO17 transposase